MDIVSPVFHGQAIFGQAADNINSRLLVRHPDVLQKLREEISLVIGNTPDFERDDLQKLEYLTMVLKESKLDEPSTG